MLFFYNALQLLCLPLAAPIVATVCLAREKHRGQFPKRIGKLPDIAEKTAAGPKRIWIHSMSLGEFNATRPLIQTIKKKLPGSQLVLTASTASGLAAIEKSPLSQGAIVTALPFDILPVVDRVIRALRPDCFLLVETDIWPNLLWRLNRYSVPSILINGSISEKSTIRLKKIRMVADFLYRPFSLLVMQSEDDAKRILRLGISPDKVISCGNLKFDHQPSKITPDEKEALFNATGFPKEAKIIVAGSTHPGEEQIIAEAFSKTRKILPNSRLVIAPRDIKRAKDVEKIFRQWDCSCTFRSNVQGVQSLPYGHDVFILDSLGELEKFYSLAHISFVGGSMVPVGGHNILEPAVFGVPVIFGPFMESFSQTASIFLNNLAGFQASSPDGLGEIFIRLLTDEKSRKRAGEAARSLLEKNRGVVDRYIEILSPYLEHRQQK